MPLYNMEETGHNQTYTPRRGWWWVHFEVNKILGWTVYFIASLRKNGYHSYQTTPTKSWRFHNCHVVRSSIWRLETFNPQVKTRLWSRNHLSWSQLRTMKTLGYMWNPYLAQMVTRSNEAWWLGPGRVLSIRLFPWRHSQKGEAVILMSEPSIRSYTD